MIVLTRHAVVSVPLAPDTAIPQAITDAMTVLAQLCMPGMTVTAIVRCQLSPRDAQAWQGWVWAQGDGVEVTALRLADGRTIWISYGPTSQVEVWS